MERLISGQDLGESITRLCIRGITGERERSGLLTKKGKIVWIGCKITVNNVYLW